MNFQTASASKIRLTNLVTGEVTETENFVTFTPEPVEPTPCVELPHRETANYTISGTFLFPRGRAGRRQHRRWLSFLGFSYTRQRALERKAKNRPRRRLS